MGLFSRNRPILATAKVSDFNVVAVPLSGKKRASGSAAGFICCPSYNTASAYVLAFTTDSSDNMYFVFDTGDIIKVNSTGTTITWNTKLTTGGSETGSPQIKFAKHENTNGYLWISMNSNNTINDNSGGAVRITSSTGAATTGSSFRYDVGTGSNPKVQSGPMAIQGTNVLWVGSGRYSEGVANAQVYQNNSSGATVANSSRIMVTGVTASTNGTGVHYGADGRYYYCYQYYNSGYQHEIVCATSPWSGVWAVKFSNVSDWYANKKMVMLADTSSNLHFFGTHEVAVGGKYPMFIGKLNTSGVQSSTKKTLFIDGASNTTPEYGVRDSSGNMYIFGKAGSGATSATNAATFSYTGYTTGFIVKYDSSLNLQWCKYITGGYYIYPAGLELSADGNYLIAGFSQYDSTAAQLSAFALKMPVDGILTNSYYDVPNTQTSGGINPLRLYLGNAAYTEGTHTETASSISASTSSGYGQNNFGWTAPTASTGFTANKEIV